jgi:uncharacterized protein YjiS (DUF1127 family)
VSSRPSAASATSSRCRSSRSDRAENVARQGYDCNPIVPPGDHGVIGGCQSLRVIDGDSDVAKIFIPSRSIDRLSASCFASHGSTVDWPFSAGAVRGGRPAKSAATGRDLTMRWLVHVLARLAITATCTNSAAALEAPFKPINPLFASNSLSEQMMSNSLERAKTSATRHGVSRQALRLASYDRRAVAAEESRYTSRSEVSTTTGPDVFWSALFWSALEGFALYGAALHGIVTTRDAAPAGEAQQPPTPPWRERRQSIALVPAAIDHDGTRVVVSDQAVRPARLTAAWRVIADQWAKWRREREISRAVEALRQFDDRTLRDMGIPHRSVIDQTVRYGRDY